jgi:hypothetical protein
MNTLKVVVPGKSALAELERLRLQFSSTGLYPILFGDDEDYARIPNSAGNGAQVKAILQESQQIDPSHWFRQKFESDRDSYPADDGDWPEWSEELGIVTHLECDSCAPKAKVLIGLLKVAEPWESFAYLNWGGWADCPSAAEHCAIHRYWAEHYGAEVVSITGNAVQCYVRSPPETREIGLRLAREQYIYCPDIVNQGTRSIAQLAAGLIDSRCWYFGWA